MQKWEFFDLHTKNWSQMLNTEGTWWQLSSVLVGCFLFRCMPGFFCIVLLYKMCLEIVVIYSSRNTSGYTVVLWNSWDERELNRLSFLHCLVRWKQSQYFNKPKKALNACVFVGGISEGVFATLLMPLFCCPKLLVRVAIWDSWECTSEVCKAKCRFGVAFVCLFFPVANRVLFSNLRFWFFQNSWATFYDSVWS